MEPLEMPVETITAEVMSKCATPVSDDHDEKYGVPSLEELGKPRYIIPIPSALLKKYVVVSRRLCLVCI